MKHKINLEVFLHWYLYGVYEYKTLANIIIKEFEESNARPITARDLFNYCGKIPGSLIYNCNEDLVKAEDCELVF